MPFRKRLLFLCTGNSCRSQMAEGLLRAIGGDRFEVFSAGIERHGLNPMAVEVMQDRRVRDEIKPFITELPSKLGEEAERS